MARVRFSGNKQGKFLNKIKKEYKLKWPDMARVCKVHRRTFFDWRRNKYQMSYAALQMLRKKYNVSLPKKIEILSENWNNRNAAELGAIRRNELYGNPGTPEGRRNGGLISSFKFRTDPEFAKKVGFKLRKQIIYPQESSLLAEFVGIVLGDGTISEFQVRISVNSKTDRGYTHFIKKVVTDLFKITSTKIAERKKNTLEISISSKNLVSFLLECGLKKGNKIAQMIDVPRWVFRDKEFIKGCLRGLIDTDGGIYFHNHATKGIRYRNMGLCFTSYSSPLLDSVYKMLLGLDINAKSDGKRHIFIYNRNEINKYMQIIGSHNSKHIKRFKSYKNSKV